MTPDQIWNMANIFRHLIEEKNRAETYEEKDQIQKQINLAGQIVHAGLGYDWYTICSALGRYQVEVDAGRIE